MMVKSKKIKAKKLCRGVYIWENLLIIKFKTEKFWTIIRDDGSQVSTFKVKKECTDFIVSNIDYIRARYFPLPENKKNKMWVWIRDNSERIGKEQEIERKAKIRK